jgi:hypothetical protein
MTINEMADLIQSTNAGGFVSADLLSRFDTRDIKKCLEIFYMDMFSSISKTVINTKAYSLLDPYTKPYEDIPVLFNEHRKEHYIELPTAPLLLPDNRGIRKISPMKDPTIRVWMSYGSNQEMTSRLEGPKALGFVIGHPEGDKVYFSNYNPDYKHFLVKLVVGLGDFDEDEEIPMFSFNASQIFQSVAAIMMQRPPEKSTNDNQSKA